MGIFLTCLFPDTYFNVIFIFYTFFNASSIQNPFFYATELVFFYMNIVYTYVTGLSLKCIFLHVQNRRNNVLIRCRSHYFNPIFSKNTCQGFADKTVPGFEKRKNIYVSQRNRRSLFLNREKSIRFVTL